MKRLVTAAALLLAGFAYGSGDESRETQVFTTYNNVTSASIMFDSNVNYTGSHSGKLGRLVSLPDLRMTNTGSTVYNLSLNAYTTTVVIDTSTPIRGLMVYCTSCSATEYVKCSASFANGTVGSNGGVATTGSFFPAGLYVPFVFPYPYLYQTTGNSVTLWLDGTNVGAAAAMKAAVVVIKDN